MLELIFLRIQGNYLYFLAYYIFNSVFFVISSNPLSFLSLIHQHGC